MALKESVDCDASCSGLDTIGLDGQSHEQCEKAYRRAVKPSFAVRCFEFGVYMRDNHPTTYKILKIFGL